MYNRVTSSRKRLILTSGFLLFFPFLSLSGRLPRLITLTLINSGNISRGVIIKKFSRIRSGPDINSNFLFLAKENDTIQITGEKNGWYRIRKDDITGWAGNETINKLPDEKNQRFSKKNSLTITKNYARIRKVPNKHAPFLFLAKKGKNYKVLGQNDNWFLIEFENDRKGWIESEYTDKQPDIISPEPEKNLTRNHKNSVNLSDSAKKAKKTKKDSADTIIPETSRTDVKEEKENIEPSESKKTISRKWMPKIRIQSEPIKKVIKRITHKEQNAAETVQISSPKPVPLRKELDPNSPIIGMVRKGTTLELIQSGESWSKIIYKNDTGWVEKRYLKVTETSSSPVMEEFLIFIVFICLIAAVIALIRLINKRPKKFNGNLLKTETHNQKRAVIFSFKEKIVSRHLTDNRSTLKQCFTEIGFSVTYCRSYKNLLALISHTIPDVILIDWELDRNIHKKAGTILTSKTSTSNIFTIFYNIPDPDKIKPSKSIPNSQFLSINFSDRDIFSLLTPLILTGDTKKKITKSVEEAALEGMVEEGSLSEVFQFIEIGNKTGGLIIETGKPFGIIYFSSGIIKYSSTKNNTGKDAVLEILNMKKGKYAFVLNRTTEKQNCSIPALGILMEWAREKDEGNVH